MKTKVLMVVNNMNMGGIENFVMNVVRNIDRNKFEIDFLYCEIIDTYFDEEIRSLGFSITKICSRTSNIFKHLSDLKKFFKENKYDAVHINYSNSLCFTVARAAKRAGVKNIIVHSHSSNASRAKLHNFFKPLVSKYANIYLSCSELASEWMFTKEVIIQGKAQVINNAIQTEKYLFSENKREKIRMELNISENDFVVGHVGRLSPEKNHEFLIDVFNKFHETNPQSKLLLIGDGHIRNALEEKIASLGIKDSVIFAGIRNDINEALSAMDCFVMPSIYEGLPVTLVEAQSAGLRCLVSDTITKLVSVTDIVDYFSLEKSAKEWATMIKTSPVNRVAYNELVKKTDFDINNEVQKLEKIYNR